MMIQTAINLLMQFSALVVFFCSMTVINNMTHKTNHFLRLAYCLISTSALTGVLAPMFSNWLPTMMCSTGMLGFAILFAVDRRRAMISEQKSASIHMIHKQQRHG